MIVCDSQNTYCMIHCCSNIQEKTMRVQADKANLIKKYLQVDEFVVLLASTIDDMTVQ